MGFLRKFGSVVTGILNGFDRLVFRATLRALAREEGVVGYLLGRGFRFVDFGAFAEAETKKLIEASLAGAGRSLALTSASSVERGWHAMPILGQRGATARV